MAEQDIMTTIYEGLSIKPSPGDSASDLVSAIQSLYDEYKTAYRDEWDRLTANEKMYHGDHWSDTGSGSNEPQPVMPIIFSTVENIQADLMDEYPEAVITPESSNDEKIGKILTRVVAQNHEACDYLYEYNDLIHDLLVGGYMIQEVGWDPTLNYGFGGAYIRYVSNKNIMFDPLCANIQDGRAVFKIERLPTLSRDAAINAGVEIQTNAEVVAAKKQAVESAENDAAVKVENANNKVTQAEQRLAGIDDPDPVKKGKKLTQTARELTAAKAAASQTASEGQKKVDTATADYKSEAAKAKRKNAANQQLVDEYHASKYYSDIERDAANAHVGGSAADPAANTNADANTAQRAIDSIKSNEAQGDNRGFDARGNEIEYELNYEAKKTLAQKYMTPEIQAHIAAMMEMPQTIDDNSPERQQYRIAKADEYYDKYQAANKNREAYIVIGPPAAGKSTIADPLVERTGSILIDSDIIKMGDKARGFEGIPEYGDGIGANAVHKESAQIADGIFVKAIAHGDNLVYPKVGGSAKSIRELAQQLKKHGYTTTLILNELPIEKALERNNNRYNETGRLVRPDYLLSVGNKPIKTYLELQGEGVFDGYERYSNDVNRGEAPFRVLEADKERPVVLRRGGSGRQTSDGDIIETGRADSRGEGTEVAPQFSPALKDLGANTPTPAELSQSKVYTNTYDKWLTDAKKAADSAENSVYAVSKESDSIAMAKERVRASIDKTGGIDEAIHDLAHGSWDAPDVDTAMLIGETLRAEAAETGDYTKLNDWKKEIQRHMTESGQAIQALAKWTRSRNEKAETTSGLFQVHIFFVHHLGAGGGTRNRSSASACLRSAPHSPA